MKMKVCNKCGKIIEWSERCKCKEYIPKSVKAERVKDIDKELRTVRWSRKREHIIKRDGALCQRCLIKFNRFNTEELQVHHIIPRTKDPSKMYDDDNLITICKTCNLQLGTREVLDFEKAEEKPKYSL